MSKRIFGYGSLINIDSLKETVPDAQTITPCTLQGYVRVFDTTSSTRFTRAGEPVSVLNIRPKENYFVNGVCFMVSEEYFASLQEREGAYDLKEVLVEAEGKELPAFVFIGKTDHKSFLFEDEVQTEYLQICLDGAKRFGEEYYRTFLETTFIDGKNLTEIAELQQLL